MVRPAAVRSRGRLTRRDDGGTCDYYATVRDIGAGTCQTNFMASKVVSAAGHFGRQMRKERLAHGWSLPEFSTRVGFDAGHLSRVENGKRPPSEALAIACDEVFTERRGWFLDWYEESRHWAEVPPGFRNWAELEDKATRIFDWAPGIVTGLLQTEDYACALLATYPGASEEAVKSRLAARMERQRRVLMRDNPPLVWFVVDQMAFYRLVGSPAVMAAQMRQLAAVAAMPNVTLQVLPAIGHPATTSGFVLADETAYIEHITSGFVYTDETISTPARMFDSLRAECYRASESLALIDRTAEAWTGGSPVFQALTVASA
jgi:transcriptional regulator with XRE-family HTH domain